MKSLAITLILVFLFALSKDTYAYEFKHLSLKNELADLDQVKTAEKDGLKLMSAGPSKKKKLEQIIYQKMFGAVTTSGQKSLIGGGLESADSNISPVYQRILDFYGENYSQIGERETNPLARNYQFGGGVTNFSGMAWHKPMGNFTIYANREIAPEYLSDKYIVHDTFVVGIDATTLLTNLEQENLIDIDEEGKAVFAGLSFTRTYHVYHLADSYLDGIKSDFSKLFVPFLYFNADSVLKLESSYLLKKQDEIHVNAGGFVNSPSVYGFSVRAGAMVNVAYKNEVAIQTLGQIESQQNRGEKMRISNQKEVNTAVDVHVSVQLDLYNIIQLTLISYDFEFSHGQTKNLHLTFNEEDKNLIKTNNDYKKEFASFIRGYKNEPKLWKKNVTQLDDNIEQAMESRLGLFLFGDIRKKETETIHTIKDGEEKTFFRHYSESTQYVQNFLSKLISMFMDKLLNFSFGVKNSAEVSKKMTVEYEKKEYLNADQAESTEDFSLTFKQFFHANKTQRKIWHKPLRKKALEHIKSYTNLDPQIASAVSKRDLIGPMTIETDIHVEKSGLAYFHNISETKAISIFREVCRRSKFRKKVKSSCFNKLNERYFSYVAEWKQTGIMNLKKLRLFMGYYFKQAGNYQELNALFGNDNVFMQGHISAQMKEGLPFQTFFNSGQFKSLGVIDSYMRESTATTPSGF